MEALCGTALCGTALCGTALCGTALCGTALCGTALCGTALCGTALCGTALCGGRTQAVSPVDTATLSGPTRYACRTRNMVVSPPNTVYDAFRAHEVRLPHAQHGG